MVYVIKVFQFVTLLTQVLSCTMLDVEYGNLAIEDSYWDIIGLFTISNCQIGLGYLCNDARMTADNLKNNHY